MCVNKGNINNKKKDEQHVETVELYKHYLEVEVKL